jgi:hypothetical protein
LGEKSKIKKRRKILKKKYEEECVKSEKFLD